MNHQNNQTNILSSTRHCPKDFEMESKKQTDLKSKRAAFRRQSQEEESMQLTDLLHDMERTRESRECCDSLQMKSNHSFSIDLLKGGAGIGSTILGENLPSLIESTIQLDHLPSVTDGESTISEDLKSQEELRKRTKNVKFDTLIAKLSDQYSVIL